VKRFLQSGKSGFYLSVLEEGQVTAGAKLDDTTLDRIDEIVPPATDIAPLEHSAYVPPAIKEVTLRRRPIGKRAVA
jgi:MOSC domain-containing protein YiiM